jgi:hypothetical protein
MISGKTAALIAGGFLGGVICTIATHGPSPVDVKVVKVPEVHTKRIEVPGPETFTPLPESCADAVDMAGFLNEQLNAYYKPVGKAKLTLEKELMPAALLGDIAALNAANIKVETLMRDSGSVLYNAHSLKAAIEASTATCESELAAAEEGDLDYEPSDGEHTDKSVMLDLYFTD